MTKELRETIAKLLELPADAWKIDDQPPKDIPAEYWRAIQTTLNGIWVVVEAPEVIKTILFSWMPCTFFNRPVCLYLDGQPMMERRHGKLRRLVNTILEPKEREEKERKEAGRRKLLGTLRGE